MTSPTTPAATHDHLTVRGTKGKGAGRSLHATGARAYRPGDLIATFTDPLLVLPKGPAAKTVCNNCLAAPRGDQATTSCKACTGCKAVSYCGPACQKADWARVHKLECKAFRKVRASVGKDWLPTPVRALLQILRRWEAEEAVRDAFGRLEGNVDGFRKREDVWKEIGLQAYGGMAYAGRKETDDQLHMARDILCKIQTNAFDRTDVDTGQAGIFLHPKLAMVNHSCVPNAAVSFSGRKAFLRAELPIKEGDEMTISYIDYTKPKLFRQLGLDLYHFQCACPRCRDDLTVYEVAQTSPVIPLNAHSLVPNVDKLRNLPISLPKGDKELKAFKESIEEIYAIFQGPLSTEPINNSTERLFLLHVQWQHCEPLIRAEMWAQEPLALTIEHAIMYYTETGSFAHALAVSCLAALKSHPYKYPAPFREGRLKGLMVIAKTLTNTASPSAMAELEARAAQSEQSHISASSAHYSELLFTCLKQVDQVSVCEALALMVERDGPLAAPSEDGEAGDEWEIVGLAKSMLKDIASLPGREKEAGLLRAWVQNHDEAGKKYFQEQVLRPIEDMAVLAVEILKADLEDDSFLDVY